METEQNSALADESLDDPFDLDIRIYPVVFEGDDDEALASGPTVSSAGACGTRTSGCF